MLREGSTEGVRALCERQRRGSRATRAQSVAALSLLIAGCGAAPHGTDAPAPHRHSERVDAVVIRTLTTERGVELDADALAAVRVGAVRGIAEALDALSADEVESLRLDINLAELGPRGNGTRASCLITVSTVGPPERMRAILQGAATVHATDRPRIAASEGAVRAALRRLPQALAAL